MPVSLVRGPLSLDIGAHKWYCRAAQLNLLPASAAPSTPLGDRAYSDLFCTMPRDMHASWVRGHLSSDIGPLNWPRTAAQMNWFSASTAPSSMLWNKSSSDLFCTMPWNVHASLVRGPLSLDIGPPKWHCRAAQMNLLSAYTAPSTML